MVSCPKCGHQNLPSATTCSQCGTPLPAAVPGGYPGGVPGGIDSVEEYARQMAAREAVRRRNRMIIGVIALAVWLAVVTSLAPARLLTYVAFFAPLWVAVAALSSAAIYRIAGADGEPRLHFSGDGLRRERRRRPLVFSTAQRAR